MAGKAIQKLQSELELLHGDNEKLRKALAGKSLAFAVKETVKGIIDGVQPTEETVKELIDMDKLARHPEVEKTEESRQQYAAAVLRACEHARKHLD